MINNEFMLGCNYWASNAGTEMWVNWKPEVIERDFESLRSYGIKYLRAFPNWRDFQPIHPLLGGSVQLREYRLHDADLPENPYYIDSTMIERFGVFCDLAEKYKMKLIVGLITGWMSGRTFIPPALYGKDLAKDPTALLFEQKFVHGMATIFKDKPAIYAWDLGNECNVLVGAKTRDEAENWSMIISNAIRTADPNRPIVSGMDGRLGVEGVWRISDQAENTDILTTHPYPYWCDHSSEGEVTSVQTLMHATCSTKYYADIGGKGCLVEEIGTMGPMICDNETSANFLKLNLYSNWVNSALGVMWWCANEQIDLMFPPYDDNMPETELGMFDRTGKPKPVLDEYKKFSDWLSRAKLTLPKAEEDAVCLVTKTQDQWGCAYCSYVFARQAGVNISFADVMQGIPESNIYLMPSISGNKIMAAQNYRELIEKVASGAILYVSIDDGLISDFNNLAGIKVNNSRTKEESGLFELRGKKVLYERNRKYIITTNGAEAVACEENGEPIFTKYKYGKGTVYFLNFPMEKNAIGVCDAFDGDQHKVYEEIFADAKRKYLISVDNKYIGMTRHIEDDFEMIVMINYSPKSQVTDAKVKSGYRYEVLKGDISKIEPFEMTIVKIFK